MRLPQHPGHVEPAALSRESVGLYGPASVTGPRQVTAVCRFRAGPGRERDAAEAWGFELKYYFHRGVGDTPPQVTYVSGVYTCRGTIITTHPGDAGNVVEFGPGGWDLDFCADAERRAALRQSYRDWQGPRFDGGSHGGAGWTWLGKARYG